MCGLAGFIGLDNFKPSKKDITDCLKSLKRRGPDSKEFFKEELIIKEYYFFILDYQLLT